jgi:hypothetical protein
VNVEAWFASGRVADIALAALLLEGLAIAVLYQRTGRGLSWSRLWPNLLAGAALLLALRSALTGASWPWIAATLLAAFAANLLDLRQRIRAGAPGGDAP